MKENSAEQHQTLFGLLTEKAMCSPDQWDRRDTVPCALNSVPVVCCICQPTQPTHINTHTHTHTHTHTYSVQVTRGPIPLGAQRQ